jgi:hypothetical protein
MSEGKGPIVRPFPLFLALIHSSAWKVNSANFACTPVLCDSLSYVEDHKPIDVYIRNIIPPEYDYPAADPVASGPGLC